MIELALLTVGLWAMFLVPANAYIDAGSTTIIFQTVVAALVAGSVTIKLYWRRLVAFFGDDEPTGADVDEAEAVADDSPLAAAEDR